MLTYIIKCDIMFIVVFGEVSEWFKELVLKTSDAKAPRVRISASPFFNIYLVLSNLADGTNKYGEVLKW